MRLRVWLDYACPFCYIGHGLVDRFREAFPDTEVEWRGFELHPEIPAGGAPLERVVPYAADRARVHAWLARVAEAAGVPPPPQVPGIAPNTRRAHLAAAWVAEHEPVALDAFHHAVLRAYWEEGANVGEAGVLAEAARAAGVTDVHALVRAIEGPLPDAAFREGGEDAGVAGVPTFDFLGARTKRRVVGAQPFDVLEKAARQVVEADREVEA